MQALAERNECGNTLLMGCDSNKLVAIYRQPWPIVDRWTLFEYMPDNYPAGRMVELDATEAEIANLVRTDYAGYEVRKLNLEGVEIDGDNCVKGEADKCDDCGEDMESCCHGIVRCLNCSPCLAHYDGPGPGEDEDEADEE